MICVKTSMDGLMEIQKRFALIGGLAVGVLACEQNITTPGSCPEFCPNATIELIDTVLTGVLEGDTSFTGYVESSVANAMQVAGGGAAVESRGLIWFAPFGDSTAIDSLVQGPVVRQDSFQLDLVLRSRSPDVTGLQITVHRITPSANQLGDFAELAPFFEDSTIIATLAIPDTVTADTVSVIIPRDAFPDFEANEYQVAVGLSIRGSTPAFADFRTLETTFGAGLSRYVLVESGVDSLERTEFRAPEFDGFVGTDLPGPPPGALLVGGTPSARAFLRVNLPPVIMDSSEIVRGTLLFVPLEPALGAPTDTFLLVAEGLGADFGAKSPILPILDTLLVRTRVGVGSTDTVSIDISSLLAFWQRTPDAVRSLVVHIDGPRRTGIRFNDGEGASVAQIRLASTRILGMEPTIRVTYVPPFRFVQ